MDRQTLRDCVHRYNEWGVTGLADRKPPGSPPKLRSEQFASPAALLSGIQPDRKYLAVSTKNYLAHRIFDSYAAIVEACGDAWNKIVSSPGMIKSIAIRSWAAVNV